MEPEFSQNAQKWLEKWMSEGKEKEILSDEIREEIINAKLVEFENQVILFRGSLKSDIFEIEEDNVYIIFEDLPSSWTLDKEVAKNFSKAIISINITSDDVLIDSTILSYNYVENLGGFPDEVEVILLPGKYLTNLFPKDILLRGKLIFGPCGIGKSFFLNKRGKELAKLGIIVRDGDELLEEANVKNRNFYWYDNKRKPEREKIIKVLENNLMKGIHILYSGNPLIYKPDMIIHIDSDVRFKRLQKRKLEGGFCPSMEQFKEEENAYLEAMDKGISFVESFEELEKIL